MLWERDCSGPAPLRFLRNFLDFHQQPEGRWLPETLGGHGVTPALWYPQDYTTILASMPQYPPSRSFLPSDTQHGRAEQSPAPCCMDRTHCPCE